MNHSTNNISNTLEYSQQIEQEDALTHKSKHSKRQHNEFHVEVDFIKATNKLSGNHSTIMQTYVDMMSWGQRTIAEEESFDEDDGVDEVGEHSQSI